MSTTSASPEVGGQAAVAPRDLPVRIFRAVAAVIAAFVLTGPGGAIDLLAPVTLQFAGSETAELHRWHMVDLSAYLSLLTVGTLVVAVVGVLLVVSFPAVAFGLLLTAWVATTDVGGARGLALVVAVTLTYLAVSALVHGTYDGAWAGWGAVSALISGALFAASARRAAERPSA